jgi:hypothetical protein
VDAFSVVVTGVPDERRTFRVRWKKERGARFQKGGPGEVGRRVNS